jgi:hypothetical protein
MGDVHACICLNVHMCVHVFACVRVGFTLNFLYPGLFLAVCDGMSYERHC